MTENLLATFNARLTAAQQAEAKRAAQAERDEDSPPDLLSTDAQVIARLSFLQRQAVGETVNYPLRTWAHEGLLLTPTGDAALAVAALCQAVADGWKIAATDPTFPADLVWPGVEKRKRHWTFFPIMDGKALRPGEELSARARVKDRRPLARLRAPAEQGWTGTTRGTGTRWLYGHLTPLLRGPAHNEPQYVVEHPSALVTSAGKRLADLDVDVLLEVSDELAERGVTLILDPQHPTEFATLGATSTKAVPSGVAVRKPYYPELVAAMHADRRAAVAA